MSSNSMRFGMDYGGTNLKTGLFDEAGEAVAFEQTPLRDYVTAEGNPPAGSGQAGDDLLANLVDYARRFTDGHGVTAGGLAIKGLVDPALGGVAEDLGEGEWLAGRDLRAAFSEALGVPFAVENDARAYAWGEWRFGAGRGTAVMACLTLGTGLGGALVAHGQPYHGADALGGILGGHLTIDRNGAACPCGSRGCLELYCSATALRARVTEAHPELAEVDTLPAFFDALRARNTKYQPTLEAFLDDLALGVVNVVHAYGPDRVVIGGGVMESADLILPGLNSRVGRMAWTVPRGRVGVVAAALGNRAAALGAAFHPSLEAKGD